MTIDQMIDDVIRREGGYVDHPADRGGPTKHGITQKTLDRWCQDNGLVRYDVATMAETTARAIYRDSYFDEPGIDKLPPSIQPFLFDAAVNHGPRQAVKFLQLACREMGLDLEADGVVGPKTIQAAHALDLHDLRRRATWHRKNFYHNIAARDPSQEVFLRGWLNRVAEFEDADEAATRLV